MGTSGGLTRAATVQVFPTTQTSLDGTISVINAQQGCLRLMALGAPPRLGILLGQWGAVAVVQRVTCGYTEWWDVIIESDS